MSEALTDDRLASALGAHDSQTRLRAIAEITANPVARLSERALDTLIGCLGAEHKAVQRRAVDALAAAAGRDDRVVRALRAALDAADARQRWGAAYTLGVIGGALDLRAQKALLEALSNPDGDVRWAAAELIVRLGGENPNQVRRGLIGLGRHRDHNARKMAIYCLRDLKFADPEVRATVERAGTSAEPGVRLAALSLLSRLPDADDGARGIAMRCLESDTDPGVRRAAAIALGAMGERSAEAREALERAARQSDDAALVKAARQALDKLERSR